MALLCETQDVYCIVSCKMCVSGCSAPSWIRALKTFPRRNISSLKWPNWIRLPATFLWPTNQDRAKTENFSNLSKQEKQQRINKTWSPISKSIRQSFNGKLKFCFFWSCSWFAGGLFFKNLLQQRSANLLRRPTLLTTLFIFTKLELHIRCKWRRLVRQGVAVPGGHVSVSRYNLYIKIVRLGSS